MVPQIFFPLQAASILHPWPLNLALSKLNGGLAHTVVLLVLYNHIARAQALRQSTVPSQTHNINTVFIKLDINMHDAVIT